MQYELYIDIFFLVNFVLDFLVLLIIKQMLPCTATHGNVLLGAITGAGLASIVVCLPIAGIWKNLLLHVLVNTIMLKVTFRVRRNVFFKAWILLYLVGIMIGGVLTFLSQYMGKYFRMTSLFLFVALCSYSIVSKAMDFLEMYWKVSGRKRQVILYWNGKTQEVSAIKDTGNMLFDAVTGEPVHVISNNAIKKFTNERISTIRYIPYHTVQNENSIMPLIRIDKMRIRGKQEVEIEKPLLGISECTHFGNGDYEMILHPKGLWED